MNGPATTVTLYDIACAAVRGGLEEWAVNRTLQAHQRGELVATLAPGAKIVGMATFAGRVILATESGVYSMGEGEKAFAPIPLEGVLPDLTRPARRTICAHNNTRPIRPESNMDRAYLECTVCGAQRNRNGWL